MRLAPWGLLLSFCVFAALPSPVAAQNAPITFSAMGDIPYGTGEVPILLQQIADHNRYSPSEFMVHVGDIKSGSMACTQGWYVDVAGYLKMLAVPTFIIPGDNEWNDCSNPDQAWGYWVQHFNEFEKNFCGAPVAERQSVRHENFAFVRNGVLFIGINLVGGSVHNQSEWNTRMQQDADWVDQQFDANVSQVRAAVVFGHTTIGNAHHDLFFNQFRADAAAFAKPVMYVHGDGHAWRFDRPWPEQNIQRMEVDNGAAEDPVQVTVTMDAQNPWTYVRDPFQSNPPVVNKAPCVEAGPDLMVTLPAAASLSARATDDGDPASPGTLTLTWSKVSGPGTVTFGNPNAAVTTATVSAAGSYVLRLTASDGQLQTSDDLTLAASGGGPQLSINDVTVTEGNGGSINAVFTVTLTGGTGAAVSVAYATAGSSATSGSDFVATFGTLNFSGATTTRPVTVPVNGDLSFEGTESFFVNLSSPSGAGIVDGQGLGTILDNDPAPQPSVASFSPQNGPVGTSVVIIGGNFIGVTAVRFNGVAATTFTVQSTSLIDATVPAGATTGRIAVTTPGGTAQSASDFIVTGPPPTLSFSPSHDAHVNSGSVSSNYGSLNNLRLRGGSGSYNSYLKFDLTGITQSVQSAKLRLFCTDESPDGGAVHLVSNNYTGGSIPWVESGLTWANSPAIGGSPVAASQAAGTNVWVEYDVTSAITGNGTYSFGLRSASTNSTYYTSDEGTSNRPTLLVQTASGPPPTPTVTAFSPASGHVGAQVIVDGSGFVGVTGVTFNGLAAASFTVETTARLRATVPVGATTGRIAVANPQGTGVSAADFTVVGPPAVASYNPGHGATGTSVAITGSNFVAVTGVSFNGVAATTFTVQSTSLIDATVPAGATTGRIAVTTPGGTAQSGTDFIVTGPPPTLSFSATHDAHVNSGSVSSNYGSLNNLRLRGGSGSYNSYLKFDLTGITQSVQSAKLRLFCTDESPDGGAVHLVSNNYASTSTPWLESGLTWSNAPAFGGSPVAPSQAAGTNVWVEYDVTAAITGNGTYSFGLRSASTNSTYYTSDEGASNRPTLVVQTASPPPLISSFAPASGPAGTEVTVDGSGFVGVTGVTFNGVPASSFTVGTPIRLRATVPSGATTGRIAVVNGNGTGLSVSDFTVIQPPTISFFAPQAGPIGGQVSVHGTGLASATAVTFNGAGASFIAASDTLLMTTVPASAGSGPITVTNPAGTATSTTSFAVVSPPTITFFSPASGSIGSDVEVHGSSFSSTGTVTFNGAAADFTVEGDTLLHATVPEDATAGPIAVTNPGGTATSTQSFTVLLPPVITSFAPTSGPVGEPVAVHGSGLANVTAVTFDDVVAGFTVASDTLLQATVPSGATTGRIAVTNSDGVARTNTDFTVIQPPTIASFAPASGPAGTDVIVTGTGFAAATAVAFNGQAASFTAASDTLLHATAPASAGSGTIAVANPAGTATTADSFTVIPSPVITFFAPPSDTVGSQVTVHGSSFTSATAVTFNGHAAGFTVSSDTLLLATVPAGASSGPIAITNPAGTATSAQSFIVIRPPVITFFAPTSGPLGEPVAVHGSGFISATAVT
ncbi:MAG TPA: IPT/TIG domain-containing protein, partial [Candidatus Limnocylindria bacterium]|nr:IPT/TIG domain-containing protein [Candidatus Limnocylindria bacterium]